jgi:hypothetical protein
MPGEAGPESIDFVYLSSIFRTFLWLPASIRSGVLEVTADLFCDYRSVKPGILRAVSRPEGCPKCRRTTGWDFSFPRCYRPFYRRSGSDHGITLGCQEIASRQTLRIGLALNFAPRFPVRSSITPVGRIWTTSAVAAEPATQSVGPFRRECFEA